MPIGIYIHKKGYKHSEETKQRISNSLIGHTGAMLGKKHTLEAIAKMKKARAKQVITLEARRKISKAHTGFRHSFETCAKISKNHARLNFGKSPVHGKGYWFDVPNQGKVFLRSSYELIMAKYLVAKKTDFRYEYRRFILNAKTFLPDFYLVEEDRFTEVKGWVKDKDLQKMKEMSIFYPDIKIEMIGKKEIKEMANELCLKL